MAELIVPAALKQLDNVVDFVNAELKTASCPMKQQMQLAAAVEEIFVNIASYAYQGESGNVTVSCEIEEVPPAAVIQFQDGGVPYNPLEKDDPDTTLKASEREIGGLGIFLVKKTMDDVSYQYKDKRNILTLKKYLNKPGFFEIAK